MIMGFLQVVRLVDSLSEDVKYQCTIGTLAKILVQVNQFVTCQGLEVYWDMMALWSWSSEGVRSLKERRRETTIPTSLYPD